MLLTPGPTPLARQNSMFFLLFQYNKKIVTFWCLKQLFMFSPNPAPGEKFADADAIEGFLTFISISTSNFMKITLLSWLLFNLRFRCTNFLYKRCVLHLFLVTCSCIRVSLSFKGVQVSLCQFYAKEWKKSLNFWYYYPNSYENVSIKQSIYLVKKIKCWWNWHLDGSRKFNCWVSAIPITKLMMPSRLMMVWVTLETYSAIPWNQNQICNFNYSSTFEKI